MCHSKEQPERFAEFVPVRERIHARCHDRFYVVSEPVRDVIHDVGKVDWVATRLGVQIREYAAGVSIESTLAYRRPYHSRLVQQLLVPEILEKRAYVDVLQAPRVFAVKYRPLLGERAGRRSASCGWIWS